MKFTDHLRLVNLAQSLVLTGGLLTLASCAFNPATGHLDTVTMSEAKEIKIGQEMHEEFAKTMAFYEDEDLNAYVTEVGKRVAATSDRPDLDYHFFIIDSPDINAFALPGGYIYVNRGLLTYLQNEAQLAAVLGHEIGHVTARHHVRQQAASAGRDVGAVFAGILTGSYSVASAAAQWSDAALAGYGRDMELEADGFGAEYLERAGYSPEAMIDVLALLKSQERFAKQQARDAGRKAASYHGVFSSHPRSDKRLQEAIAQARGDSTASGVLNEEAFREHTDGLIWGDNLDRKAKLAAEAAANQENKENRYTHNRLGFTLLYPEAWTVANQGSAIIGAPADSSASLTLTVAKVNPSASFESLLRDRFDVKLLKQSEALSQNGLLGHTGIKENGGQESRVAILVQVNRAYLFEGKVTNPQPEVDYDALFLASIRSFQPVRPTAPVKTTAKHSKTIKYVVANENTTFARLANDLKLGQYGEENLRLINGYYPRGEPYAGEVIKIIQ
ncbi:M48 family metalloprotease [Halioxenophilus sp. WMMB6]|uniref:M48 family metalloprotease n=1 Tax=Halioxenophilus sp. WMMB6 TaxID=3073815 RepID=UPI00295F3E36|nr:M48 family metalloprotease [Halioxenophilus sp. WMMB6]